MIAGSCAAIWRMPRNRPPAAAIWPSSTASTLGSRRSAKLTMPAQILVLPPRRSPSSAIAADELAFADRPHLLGTAGAIARAALDEHGRDDVVAGVDVGQELVEQIAAARVIPQMMVRVDDRQIGIENLLGELAEPCGIGQRAGIGAGFDWHGGLPEGRLRRRRLPAARFGKIYRETDRPQKSITRDHCAGKPET